MREFLAKMLFGPLRPGHTLTSKECRSVLWMLYISAIGFSYYSLKNVARDFEQEPFTFRDTLRTYGLEGAAARLDRFVGDTFTAELSDLEGLEVHYGPGLAQSN